jgi:hypothetical protein
MSFDQDPGESVTMSGADLAQIVAERDKLRGAVDDVVYAGSVAAQLDAIDDARHLLEELRGEDPRWTSPHATALAQLAAERDAAQFALAALREDRDRLDALVNSPETLKFLEGTRNEVAHQIERWGTVHDRAKEPADWFWLVGYLSGKALAAHVKGDTDKAMHHCISTEAALANWHSHVRLGGGLTCAGSSDLQQFLRETFGANFLEQQAGREEVAA